MVSSAVLCWIVSTAFEMSYVSLGFDSIVIIDIGSHVFI